MIEIQAKNIKCVINQHEVGQTKFCPPQAIKQHLFPVLQNKGGQLPFVIFEPSFCSTKLVNADEIVVVDNADVEELKYLLTALAVKHPDHGLQEP